MKRAIMKFSRDWSVLLSASLCAVMTITYWLRPNWATALTIFPAWCWLVFWLVAVWQYRRRSFLVLCALWCLFIFLHVEECKSLLRAVTPIPEQENSIKVITVNCSGSIKALEHAFLEQPDVALIQESPPRDSLENFVENLDGYTLLRGIDTSIIARGTIEPVQLESFYTAGLASIGELELFVVSLRLETSDPRIDLWAPASWRDQWKLRLKQLDQIAKVNELIKGHEHLIVGGDFNVPQGDRVFHMLDQRLTDTFKSGGRGWCNTILNDLPVLRIDQIWTSKNFDCRNSFAKQINATDHRMSVTVISDSR
ncbi:endonuclease/exonuclease/phosphatase family protein [Calycomorphotria hydatis]|uniref:Endonuclease/exonuclease/phosphatase domain-containing protein n=1 Tax=Calycomorphotria hydatis TaxID=2528027 RepID=A0A517TF44_9PLAN|nr:endonuclease/exonuclease/phosphatase family protein [Calycomorphotria hydatis]QDT66989.1 hypothetical protein V22_42610 [Calycomorphotria hydatis]